MSKKSDRRETENRQVGVPVVVKKPGAGNGLLALGLFALLAVYVVQCAHFWVYVNDDAYITYRYSRFLSMGRGPYFNIGEHVEGYTNFLLMLLLAPIIRIFENPPPHRFRRFWVSSAVDRLWSQRPCWCAASTAAAGIRGFEAPWPPFWLRGWLRRDPPMP